jgi:hypothetical protein
VRERAAVYVHCSQTSRETSILGRAVEYGLTVGLTTITRP